MRARWSHGRRVGGKEQVSTRERGGNAAPTAQALVAERGRDGCPTKNPPTEPTEPNLFLLPRPPHNPGDTPHKSCDQRQRHHWSQSTSTDIRPTSPRASRVSTQQFIRPNINNQPYPSCLALQSPLDSLSKTITNGDRVRSRTLGYCHCRRRHCWTCFGTCSFLEINMQTTN